MNFIQCKIQDNDFILVITLRKLNIKFQNLQDKLILKHNLI